MDTDETMDNQTDWSEDREELLRAYREEPGREIRARLHALWIVRGGASVTSAARTVGVASASVRRWLDWYDTGGVSGVRRRQYRGRIPRLSEAQQRALVERARVSPFLSTQDARRWAGAHLGVTYTHSGMRWLLERLGLKQPGRPLRLADAVPHGSASDARRRTVHGGVAGGRPPAGSGAGASPRRKRAPLQA